MRPFLLAIAACAPLIAQQEVWRYWPHDDWQAPFGSMQDMDGDVARELLTLSVTDPNGHGVQARVRILSGASGAMCGAARVAFAVASDAGK